MTSLRLHALPSAWRYAAVGVLASLPATVVLNWLPNSQATLGGGVMIVGAFIAGAVAATRSGDPGAAGLRAGLLGGVVGIGTFVLTAEPTTLWSLSTVGFVVVAGAVVLCLAPVFGLGCGRLGGWVAVVVSSDSDASADAS